MRAYGSFAYFPDDGYLGADSFTYRASDGSNSSETATVRIMVKDLTAHGERHEPGKRGHGYSSWCQRLYHLL